jgi:DNA-binding response OmpR family regulator
MLCLVPGEHYSTSALLEHVWHYPSGKGDSALVRNHVRNLRRKLEDDPDRPRIVQCLQGRGYTINAEVEHW